MKYSIKLPAPWIATFMSCSVLAAASGDPKLYVVSGTPGENLPVRVYALDSRDYGPLTWVNRVADELHSVLLDYGARKLVIASPAIRPTHFSFIDMNRPDSATLKDFQYDSGALYPVGVYLIDIPDAGPGIALSLGQSKTPQGMDYAPGLSFIGLNSQATATMPYEMLKYIRYAGEAGVVIVQPELVLRIVGNPFSAFTGMSKTGLGIPSPPYLVQRANTSEILVANDDAFMVTEPIAPPEPVLDILSKSSNTWRRVPRPFAEARLRTFGHWLAAVELRRTGAAPQPLAKKENPLIARSSKPQVSPGAEKRTSERIGPSYRNEPGLTADDLFANYHLRGVFFPPDN